MLHVNELMIGDWVHVEAHRGFNAQNVKVETIPDNDSDNKYGHHYGHIGTWLDGGDNDFRDVEAKHLQPIPITPEILARMGFAIEEEPKYDDTYTEDEYTATIKCVDSRKCEVEIEYNTYWKKLRGFNHDPHNRLGFTSIEKHVVYVHELQHIMRLLGIEEEVVL